MRTTQLAQRMLALFVAGALLLNYPLLRLALSGGAEAPATLLGLPRLPLLLFVGWALLIVLLALLMERGGDEPASGADASGPR